MQPLADVRQGLNAGMGHKEALVGTWWAVGFALLAAASNATATVLQRRAALGVPLEQGFTGGLVTALVRRPVWLAGIVAVMFAACFQALALNAGALSVVQPIFVLELPFALLIAVVVLRRRLARRGWGGIALIVVGLGTALWAASPSAGSARAPLDRWIPALIGCGVAITVLIAAALRRGAGRTRAACLAAAAAIGYALTAALMKTAADAWDSGGPGVFFATWQTYGFVLAGAGALFLLQNALQSGPLSASQPALTLGDAVISLTLGVTLYAEVIRTGWWLAAEAAGAALILAGAVLLATTPIAASLMAPTPDHDRGSQPS